MLILVPLCTHNRSKSFHLLNLGTNLNLLSTFFSFSEPRQFSLQEDIQSSLDLVYYSTFYSNLPIGHIHAPSGINHSDYIDLMAFLQCHLEHICMVIYWL